MATYKDTLELVDRVSEPLKKIAKNTEKTTNKTEKLKDKISKLNQNFVRIQPTLNKVWGGVVKLTRSFAGLIGSSGLITMGIARATDFADNIDKMSQKIGMSTDAYQKWNYIMSINGGNVDSLAMGFKTLTTQIEGVQKGSKDSVSAFRALGVRVKNNNGTFRKQEEIFEDTIRALQKIQDPTRKAILGNRLFGRSAAELRPLLNQSADEVDRLAESFEKYGMRLSKKEIENAVKFKDTWTTFTMFLQAQTNKALTALLPKLQGILEKIMQHREAIKKIVKSIADLSIKVFELIEYFSKHKEKLAFILGTITALGAVTLYANIVAGIAALTAAMATFGVTSNIALAGIPALIGLISTAVTVLALNWGNNWKNIGNWCKNTCETIGKWINFILEKLGSLVNLIPGVGQAFAAVDVAKWGAGKISSYRQNNISNITKSSKVINNYYNQGNKAPYVNGLNPAYIIP